MSESNLKSACPDVATLQALLDDSLSDAQRADTQAHVDQCPKCLASLRQMTAGGESWIGMAEKLKDSGEDDPKLAAAMERLKTDDGSGGESSEPADPQRTLDFLSPSDDPKSLGRLGQHEILEVIGWGGMGVVLKAYDPGLHRVVAVKVLASHLAHHAVARKRFIREAQAAAAVCHDNVVTIHAIDEAGNAFVGERGGVSPPVDPEFNRGANDPRSPMNQSLPKIVMQFVAGGSLQERIDQEGPLELKEILRIALQTAAGLAAAHAQGVVHRDVKPANILLENGVQRVKLTDFGLARVMDDASLTLSGVIAGTPQYMAPEQAWGRDVDARADLFSLGAVMYAMCSGHSPFRARTTMAVLKRVCEDQPRPLRAINPDVPDWLVAIIEKLLAKNPDDRFQSANEVSELLSRWLAHVQQPNVVERPPFVRQVSNLPVTAKEPKRRTGQVENLPHEALLAMTEFQRRPGELRQRMWLWESALWAFAAIGIPLVFVLAVYLPMNYLEAVRLAAFGLMNVLATLVVITVFRAACKTTRWLTWIGSMFFLPAAAVGFLLVASDEPASGATKLVCSVQAVVALLFTIALMFTRPPLSQEVGPLPSQRWNGWQRLFAIIFFTGLGLPLVFVLTYWFSHASERPVLSSPTKKLVDAPTQANSSSSNTIPTGQPRQNFGLPAELKGRWVVVSIEGAALPLTDGGAGATSPMSSSGGTAGFGTDGAAPSGGSGSPGIPGTGSAQVGFPLQWIEFSAEQAVLFAGREVKLTVAFDPTQTPNELKLLGPIRVTDAAGVPMEPDPNESRMQTIWHGIYRLDRDRLIICWTPGSRQPLPSEFATEGYYETQLVVLRREWNPPADHDTTKTPPRGIVPFTADEAVRLQAAWAQSANAPVETTNSLGMKFRLVPPGQFDSFQQRMLEGPSFGDPKAQPAVARPLYFATHEVTVAQFRKFVEASGYESSAERMSAKTDPIDWKHPGILQDSDEHPVVHVSWDDAQAFCRWLTETTQTTHRLPTLAEWAFAARAGLAAEIRLKPAVNARLKFFDTTAPVGGDSANLFGLHDLLGNVVEWTNQAMDPDNLARRFAVGGGFRSSMKDGYSSNKGRDVHSAESWLMPRYVHSESEHFDDIGFRVVREITPQVKPASVPESATPLPP